MDMSTPWRLFLFVITHYFTYCSCEHSITVDVLPHISKVPCKQPEGQCTLDAFAKRETNASNFLKSWMLALYFDVEKYPSQGSVDDISEAVRLEFEVHHIVLGEVHCNKKSKHNAVVASLCNNLDPSVIYAYMNGKKTDYWWSVTDLLSQPNFVVSNMLTLQYKNQMDMFTSSNLKENLQKIWDSFKTDRKLLMVVNVDSPELEVNTTDRLYAFNFIGLVLQSFPFSRAVVATGVIENGIEFWLYHDTGCRSKNVSDCLPTTMYLEDITSASSEEAVCFVMKARIGITHEKRSLELPENVTMQENMMDYLRNCPFVIVSYDTELTESLRDFRESASAAVADVDIMVFSSPRHLTRKILISLEANPDLAKHPILAKLHLESVNDTKTQNYSRLRSPVGYSIIFKPVDDDMPTSDIVKHLFNLYYEHAQHNINSEDFEFNPYLETDSVYLLWEGQKAVKSDYFATLNTTSFDRTISDRDNPAMVLFYQPWTSSSLYSRDIIFPTAADYLAKEFGIRNRLYSVNCFDYNEICEHEKVLSYPRIKVYRQGKTRFLTDTISLQNLVRESLLIGRNFHLHPKRKIIDLILNYTRSALDQVIIAVDIKDEKAVDSIRKSAELFDGSEVFIVCSLQHLPDELQKQLSPGAIVSYSSRRQPHLLSLRESNLDTALNDFVFNSHYGRALPLSWSMFRKISSTQRPLLILLVRQMSPALHCLLSGIATDRMGQTYVTWMHARIQKDLPIFQEYKGPEFVLRDPVKGVLHRRAVNVSELTAAHNCTRTDPGVAAWLDAALAGRRKADEVLTERKFLPTGQHINMRDSIYPQSRDEDEDLTPEQLSPKSGDASSEQVQTGSTNVPPPDHKISSDDFEDDDKDTAAGRDKQTDSAASAKLGGPNIGSTGLSHDPEEL